jgi:hypothetical protein
MIKFKLFFLVGYLFILNYAYSQDYDNKNNKYELTQLRDTYVAKIRIYDKLFTKKCKCLNTKKSSLFRMKMIMAYYVPDSTVYGSNELYKINYILVDKKIKLKENKEHLVTLSPAMNGGYLVLNRLLDINNPEKVTFYHKNAYLSDFTNCYKIGIWDSILLFLRIKKIEEVDYGSKKKRKDPYSKFIKEKNIKNSFDTMK